MSKLTDLVIEYKKTKTDLIFSQIYALLKKSIQYKAKVLFYSPVIAGEKNVEVFDKKTKKFVVMKKRKYIKLCETGQIALEDVEQELNLKLLQVINNYDEAKGTFDTYFFATLWNYVPEFINQEFLDQLKNVKTYSINEDGDEASIVDNIAVFSEFEEEINPHDLFENLTPQETEVLNLLLKNPKLNQTQVAEKIGVTHSRVSAIYIALRKKVIK
jgi:RNA polymerase sigma factor (sigma-70 family)